MYSTDLLHHSIKALRTLLILESKKFIWALELGATVSDLENIRDRMRQITDLIHMRETVESNEDVNTQTNHTGLSKLGITGQKNNGL